jgi:hypothetical protein
MRHYQLSPEVLAAVAEGESVVRLRSALGHIKIMPTLRRGKRSSQYRRTATPTSQEVLRDTPGCIIRYQGMEESKYLQDVITLRNEFEEFCKVLLDTPKPLLYALDPSTLLPSSKPHCLNTGSAAGS